MTLHGKGRDRIPDRQFKFPAVKKLSDGEMQTLKNAEKRIETFISLDRTGNLSDGARIEIFHVYSGLNAFNICEDKNVSKRIEAAISKLRKLMLKYDIRRPY